MRLMYSNQAREIYRIVHSHPHFINVKFGQEKAVVDTQSEGEDGLEEEFA
jgi:hypothetical protein